jgi:hypothetical protein
MTVRLDDGGTVGAVGRRGRRAKPNERRKEAKRLEGSTRGDDDGR